MNQSGRKAIWSLSITSTSNGRDLCCDSLAKILQVVLRSVIGHQLVNLERSPSLKRIATSLCVTPFGSLSHAKDSFTIVVKSLLIKLQQVWKNSVLNPYGLGFFPLASVQTALMSSSSVSGASNTFSAASENLLGTYLRSSSSHSLRCSSKVGRAYSVEQKELQTFARSALEDTTISSSSQSHVIRLPASRSFTEGKNVYSLCPRIASIRLKTGFFVHLLSYLLSILVEP